MAANGAAHSSALVDREAGAQGADALVDVALDRAIAFDTVRLKAIEDIGFRGDAMLETGSPSGDPQADARRNLAYLRNLMAQ